MTWGGEMSCSCGWVVGDGRMERSRYRYSSDVFDNDVYLPIMTTKISTQSSRRVDPCGEHRDGNDDVAP